MQHKTRTTEVMQGPMGKCDSIRQQTPESAPGDLVTIKLDSCHSTWYFEPMHMRFRRELKGIGIDRVSTGWRPYYGLRFDEELDRFTVFMNRDGTRLLSSWCHPAGCDVCANCVGHGAEVHSPNDICEIAP